VISEQFDPAGILGWEGSLSILKLFSNAARTHGVLQITILGFLNFLLIVEAEPWLLKQILIKIRSSRLYVLSKRTVFFTLLLDNSAFFGVDGMYNGLAQRFTASLWLIDIFLILFDAADLDLVALVDCEFFVRSS
jgi:hypothetical protein